MVAPAVDITQLSQWRRAVERGRGWLAAQADAAPRFGFADADLNWYCKVPWALAGSGDRARALRLVREAHAKFIEPSLRQPRETDWTNAIGYALGWLVAAARCCEAYAEARSFYQALQSYLDPETGGIISVGDKWLDASIQGAALHAAVAMGDIAAARCAGDLMVWFVDSQPRRDEAIFLHFHPKHGYLTDIPLDERTGRRVFWRGAANQPLANLGFVMQGLCRVSEATGDAKYSAAAERLLDRIIANHRDDLLSHSQNHKVAHAATLLRRLRSRTDLLPVATGIADRIAANIHPDGRSIADVIHSDISQQKPYTTVRTTSDSVLWLAQICDELESSLSDVSRM